MIFTSVSPPAICHFALIKTVSSSSMSSVPHVNSAGGRDLPDAARAGKSKYSGEMDGCLRSTLESGTNAFCAIYELEDLRGLSWERLTRKLSISSWPRMSAGFRLKVYVDGVFERSNAPK